MRILEPEGVERGGQSAVRCVVRNGNQTRLQRSVGIVMSQSGVRPGVHGLVVPDDGTGPWHAAAFSLLMLVGTLGKQYSLPEFRQILEGAGFTDVQAVRTGGGYYSLVSARKP